MCKITSKLFLLVTGVLFWAAATALCVIGGYMFYEYNGYEKIAESTHVLVPAGLFIAVGLFLFLLGIVGCVGAVKEQKCLLGFFFVVLMLIFLGLVTATVLSLVYKEQMDHSIRRGMEHALNDYKEHKEDNEVDIVQQELRCCGIDNYTDWLDTPWYKNQNKTEKDPYPESCCKGQACNFNMTTANSTGVFEHGCYEKLHDAAYNHLLVLMGVAAALAVFQLIGMIASCVLLCQRRSQVPYIGLVEPSGMRV